MSTITTLRNNIPTYFGNISRWAVGLVLFWILAMISLPIFKWAVGEGAIVWGVNLTTVLQASAVVAVLAHSWGVSRTGATAGAVIGLTWGVEAIGTATGFPFGHYDYTALLQPQVANVPVLIAIAWLMMLPSSWAMGYLITGKTRGIAFIVVSAAAMTSWDFFLDPQMVGWDLWRWEADGGYFGVPWVNFLGWFATAALVTKIVRPKEPPVVPLFTIYVIVWALQTIGQAVFWGQVGPAAVGFVTMGLFIVLGGRNLRN
ncbi:MAG: carotenoid biosynthesis protein, partial [Chloroflexota bacterium]